MIEVGRLCVKTAGRDAGKKAVIVEVLNDNRVLIDGETRRRACNVMHLVPLEQKADIKKGASHEEVAKALKELGIATRQTKPKKPFARKKSKRVLGAVKKPAKAAKPAVKTAAPAAEQKPAAKPAEKIPAAPKEKKAAAK